MAKHVPRIRKHKVKARLKAQTSGPKHHVQEPTDTNVQEVIPTERDVRREQLHAELRAQQPRDQISSKKRKRLDHYIETKLKKEENLDLIKKIGAGRPVDTSLFRSSRNLGRVKDTQRERLGRALKEREQGIDVARNERILFDRRQDVDPADFDLAVQTPASLEPDGSLPEPSPVQIPLEIGSGLKRPLDQDGAGRPLMKRRKRKKKPNPLPNLVLHQPAVESELDSSNDGDEESEWAGFSDYEAMGPERTKKNSLGSNVASHDTADSASESGTDEDHSPAGSDEETSLQGDRHRQDAGLTAEDVVKTWKQHYPGTNDDLEDESSGFDESDNGVADDQNSATDVSSDGDTSDSDNGDETDSDNNVDPDPRERVSAFKTWATQQRNAALGFTPSADTEAALPTPAQSIGKPQEKPQTAMPRVPKFSKPDGTKVLSAVIPRTDEIQEARLKLPVVQEEQRIMEVINANPTTVIWGATGSGKTTQIPQMLFESGYGCHIGDKSHVTHDRSKGMIGVTQPRRVAATSVAERVAVEMGPLGAKVGHQVRFDTTVGPSTAIKFMTDGILLREISDDFPLTKYSVIVLDEAHERSVNTDILIGLLSRIVDLRAAMAREDARRVYPLRLVIMSATLRLEDFTHNKTLFRDGPPPVVQAEGRQFTVTEHFSKRTRGDYVDEMFRKITRGHKQLPAGGMLVFLTGKDEIVALSRRLNEASASATTGYIPLEDKAHDGEGDDDEDEVAINVSDSEDSELDSNANADADADADEEKEFAIEDSSPASSDVMKMYILPLHSQLPSHQQMRVFQPPPEGSRLIVLATNVAETSLTIPGIRYVFDCGRVKSKEFDPVSGVQSFRVGFISKASAAQRAGRAGRTGPGHCYRLYSSAVFERDFEQNAIPDILRLPVENVALLIKSVDFPNVANFPFPTPPDRRALAKAEDLLRYLGAVDLAGKITDTGRALAKFPLSPRYARMLLLAHSQGLMAHAMALVAALTVPEMLLPPPHVEAPPGGADRDDSGDDDDGRARSMLQSEENLRAKEQAAAYGRAQGVLSRWDDKADALKLLTAFALCSSLASPSKVEKLARRCEQYFIREKAIKEAFELRSQLVRIAKMQLTMPETDLVSLPVLDADERAKLKYIVASGFIDQVAVRLDHLRTSQASVGASGRKPRRANEVPYRTLFPSDETVPGLSAEEREAGKNSYVHASSLLARLSVAEMPTYIVYSHLSRAAIKTVTAGHTVQKTRLHPLCVVTARQLIALTDGTPLLEAGKPIGKIEQLPRGVDDGLERRSVWVGLSLRARGEVSWPMGTRKEIQIYKNSGWLTERVVG